MNIKWRFKVARAGDGRIVTYIKTQTQHKRYSSYLKGATPVPGPIRMTGLLRSDGGWKAPPLRRNTCRDNESALEYTIEELSMQLQAGLGVQCATAMSTTAQHN